MQNSNDDLERALDEALRMTFPASDPVAIEAPVEAQEPAVETRRRPARNGVVPAR
jgi:hypothetical protein